MKRMLPGPRKRGSGLFFCNKGNEGRGEASAPTDSLVSDTAGRCGHRPLRVHSKRRGGERNLPVTASSCQPPLGKGAEGTGGTDCHSQCAHWLRNDTLYEMRYESGRATARVAPTERNKKCHGRADVGIGPYEDVTSSAGQGRVAGLQEVR